MDLSEYEMTIAAQLVNPDSIETSWNDIAGLDDIIDDIKAPVILPLKSPEIFDRSDLHQAPKGVLFHGPPGCGKTMLAKATAKEAGARFINLEVPALTDKWYGESQKLAAAVFTLAVKVQPCIIFIDEIDSFLRSRSSQDHEATAMMKAQFMMLWDGISSSKRCYVVVMGATNRPQDVDKAILRRMPAMFQIGLPKKDKRRSILELVLQNEKQEGINLEKIAEETEGFSGSDLKELCRNAAMLRVRELRSRVLANDITLNQSDLRAITGEDFKNAVHKMKESKVLAAGRFTFNEEGLD
jgi:SpoVK/Ycf46/Vps4 family AAA+-type ATPase